MQVIALISHDVDEVMLGYDYLTDNRCVWDFGNSQIFIQGKPYTPFARYGPPKCRRVFVTTKRYTYLFCAPLSGQPRQLLQDDRSES